MIWILQYSDVIRLKSINELIENNNRYDKEHYDSSISNFILAINELSKIKKSINPNQYWESKAIIVSKSIQMLKNENEVIFDLIVTVWKTKMICENIETI